mmetsp:Transcript_1070/g.1788  ORF Transcript_1070/g.1788 Transcript_1070/m.1788 type:complete len:80 (-) Transcript_1070:33-272(-)|eukprot:CAMPEP_0184288796 /NCGR_PEP_ID=MMETSP1049-20130417/1275_1 /TAXON_ID=77928 /ORGANISM="Proteomonas sulcata, Strain CCMP704" /LENGTH=79 /DNA_ID=CAMNT_0026595337 /DNA_START=274 /DNA_END=513 /DNA_ORIENTATION=+
MFALVSRLSMLNEFQYPHSNEHPCPSDDVWAGFAPEAIKGVGIAGSVEPSTVPEGDVWGNAKPLIRGVGKPGNLTANCA